MAYKRTDEEGKVTVKTMAGTSSLGEFKNFSLSHINPEASDDGAYRAGLNLAIIQGETPESIKRTHSYFIEEE